MRRQDPDELPARTLNLDAPSVSEQQRGNNDSEPDSDESDQPEIDRQSPAQPHSVAPKKARSKGKNPWHGMVSF